MDENSVELTAQFVQVLRWCRHQRREIDTVEAAARTEIEKELGDTEFGTVDGVPVLTFKHHKRTALDQRALRAEHPDVHAAYCRTDTVRRFCLLEEEGES